MSTQVKYYAEDFLSRDYGSLAVKLPMNGKNNTSAGGFFNVSYTTEDQSVSNYINLLLTRRGERYMQPEFGVGIQERLFEQNTELLRTELKAEINVQSKIWLPYIVNHNIDVVVGADIAGLAADPENAVRVIIEFSVLESNANRKITVFQLADITTVEVE